MNFAQQMEACRERGHSFAQGSPTPLAQNSRTGYEKCTSESMIFLHMLLELMTKAHDFLSLPHNMDVQLTGHSCKCINKTLCS